MDFLNGCEVEFPPSCWCSQTVTVTKQTRKDGEFSEKALVLQQLGQLKVPGGHVTTATVPLSHVSRLRLNNNNNNKKEQQLFKQKQQNHPNVSAAAASFIRSGRTKQLGGLCSNAEGEEVEA